MPLEPQHFAVASAAANSKKLKDTLGELESALTSWDQIVPSANDAAAETAPGATPRARGPGSNVPEEMKRRTRELLNQLKEQIDDLSATD